MYNSTKIYRESTLVQTYTCQCEEAELVIGAYISAFGLRTFVSFVDKRSYINVGFIDNCAKKRRVHLNPEHELIVLLNARRFRRV